MKKDMEKRNILLLSLLSLGFANSTAPEQVEQSDTRPHIQFVQRVDDSIQRAEASNLPAGTIYKWMNNASALYYDGNELRTDTDLLARALKEGYARPFLLFGHLFAWNAKMSMLSKDRKYIPDLTVDAQDRVASFLYPDSKVGMYRYSVGENGLHLNGMDVVSQDITTEELITLIQTIFTQKDFVDFLSGFVDQCGDMEPPAVARTSLVLRHDLHTNHSDTLAGSGVLQLFESVVLNLISDNHIRYRIQTKIWNEDSLLHSCFDVQFDCRPHVAL